MFLLYCIAAPGKMKRECRVKTIGLPNLVELLRKTLAWLLITLDLFLSSSFVFLENFLVNALLPWLGLGGVCC